MCQEPPPKPDRPPLKGLRRINTTFGTDAQRKRFQPKLVKKIKAFAPTVQKVKEIVPPKFVAKIGNDWKKGLSSR